MSDDNNIQGLPEGATIRPLSKPDDIEGLPEGASVRTPVRASSNTEVEGLPEGAEVRPLPVSHLDRDTQAAVDRNRIHPEASVSAAPSTWESFKGAVQHPINYLSDVEQDVEKGGGRTIAGRMLGHAQHGSMEDTGYTADKTPVASIMAGPIQGPPKVVRGTLRMAEDVKDKTIHPIQSYEKQQAGEPDEFVSGLNEAVSGAIQTPGPLIMMTPEGLPRGVAAIGASKVTQGALGKIGVPEEYAELAGNVAGGLAAGPLYDDPLIAMRGGAKTADVAIGGPARTLAKKVLPSKAAPWIEENVHVPGQTAGLEPSEKVQAQLKSDIEVARIRLKNAEKTVKASHDAGLTVPTEHAAALEKAQKDFTSAIERQAASEEVIPIDKRLTALNQHTKSGYREEPETQEKPLIPMELGKKELPRIPKQSEYGNRYMDPELDVFRALASDRPLFNERGELILENLPPKMSNRPYEGLERATKEGIKYTPAADATTKRGFTAGEELAGRTTQAERDAQVEAERAQRARLINPIMTAGEPTRAPKMNLVVDERTGKVVEKGGAKADVDHATREALGLEEPSRKVPATQGRAIPKIGGEPVRPTPAEGVKVGDTVSHKNGGVTGKVLGTFKHTDGVEYAQIEGQKGYVPVSDLVQVEPTLTPEKPAARPAAEGVPVERERSPEDLSKVDTVIKELPNQDLIRLGSRYGVDETKYDFSKRVALREGGSKHPVEREAHANTTLSALPEDLKNHIVDAANDWDAKNPKIFDPASYTNASRAERARAIMTEATKRYQDELAAKGASGASGAPRIETQLSVRQAQRTLAARGFSPDEIARMSDDEVVEAAQNPRLKPVSGASEGLPRIGGEESGAAKTARQFTKSLPREFGGGAQVLETTGRGEETGLVNIGGRVQKSSGAMPSIEVGPEVERFTESQYPGIKHSSVLPKEEGQPLIAERDPNAAAAQYLRKVTPKPFDEVESLASIKKDMAIPKIGETGRAPTAAERDKLLRPQAQAPKAHFSVDQESGNLKSEVRDAEGNVIAHVTGQVFSNDPTTVHVEFAEGSPSVRGAGRQAYREFIQRSNRLGYDVLSDQNNPAAQQAWDELGKEFDVKRGGTAERPTYRVNAPKAEALIEEPLIKGKTTAPSTLPRVGEQGHSFVTRLMARLDIPETVQDDLLKEYEGEQAALQAKLLKLKPEELKSLQGEPREKGRPTFGELWRDEEGSLTIPGTGKTLAGPRRAAGQIEGRIGSGESVGAQTGKGNYAGQKAFGNEPEYDFETGGIIPRKTVPPTNPDVIVDNDGNFHLTPEAAEKFEAQVRTSAEANAKGKLSDAKVREAVEKEVKAHMDALKAAQTPEWLQGIYDKVASTKEQTNARRAAVEAREPAVKAYTKAEEERAATAKANEPVKAAGESLSIVKQEQALAERNRIRKSLGLPPMSGPEAEVPKDFSPFKDKSTSLGEMQALKDLRTENKKLAGYKDELRAAGIDKGKMAAAQTKIDASEEKVAELKDQLPKRKVKP